MPADIDEMFTALGTHADRVPVGTPEGVRRRGERRRRRHGAAGIALVLVAAATVGITQVAGTGHPTPPAGPTPADPFIPLVDAGSGRSGGAVRSLGTVQGVDGLAYLVKATTDGALELVLFRSGDGSSAGWTSVPLIAGQRTIGDIVSRPDGTLGVLAVGPAEGQWLFVVMGPTGAAQWHEIEGDTALATGTAVVVTSRRAGTVTARDWATGEVVWQRVLDTTQGLTHVYPAAPAPPLVVGGWGVDPAEHRLVAVGADATVEVLDSRDGRTQQRHVLMSRPTSVLAVGETLYTTTEGAVWAYPLDHAAYPTRVYAGSVRIRPCGAGMVCLMPGTGPTLLLDSARRRLAGELHSGLASTVVGYRVVGEDGAVFDLAGNRVAAGRANTRTWWVAPDRVLTVTRDTRDPGTLIVGGMSTVDGAWSELGRIPDGFCEASLRYLFCATLDGIRAWQFAAG